MTHDPVEDTEEYKRIAPTVEALIKEELGEQRRMLGYCHIYWAAKKRILKEKFGIDWKSPSELNPYIIFD